MKHPLSLFSCLIVLLVLLQYRTNYSDLREGHPPLKVTEWDAFGYYAYLPATLIYHDCTRLNWLDSIDTKYKVTGGNGWQAMKADNGNYVFKYLGGVAIMQLPFFAVAHFMAPHLGYPANGFSPPYQYALGYGVILYGLLALLALRRVLLVYFSDLSVALTLIMVTIGTNYIQYAAVDNGQSHAYLFLLYSLILLVTQLWHKRPSLWLALSIGYIIGLATMSRPTEAIMLFIPLLWGTQTKESAAQKWALVRAHKNHVMAAAIAGLLGILPQLLYWKYTTGSFIFDVGSKWDFLNPNFRVLFGWEKGWFIYTPVTVLFVAGFYFTRSFPFRKAAFWFCLLNIYIIIAWHDWRYGGSYSTRALVQSYPVFALPFAALSDRLLSRRILWLFGIINAWLLFVNLFQVVQYCDTVLHYADMNRKYYGRIFLNAHPSPADMSLLDNNEIIVHTDRYKQKQLAAVTSAQQIQFSNTDSATILTVTVPVRTTERQWVRIDARILAPEHLWQSYLYAQMNDGHIQKTIRARLFSPISDNDSTNSYAMFMRIPADMHGGTVQVYLKSASPFVGKVASVSVTEFTR